MVWGGTGSIPVPTRLLVEEGGEGVLGLGATGLVDEFAAFKDEEGRDGLHAEALGERLCVLDVDFGDVGAAFRFVRELFEDGVHLLTGAAPFRPEIDEDRALCI